MENILLLPLITGGLTLLGVVITMYFNRSNLKLQLNHQTEVEAAKLKLAKLEKAHSLLSAFMFVCVDFSTNLLIVQKSQSNADYKASLMRLSDGMTEFKSIINIHAQECAPELKDLLDSIQQLPLLAQAIIARQIEYSAIERQTIIVQNNIRKISNIIEKKAIECSLLKPIQPSNFSINNK